MCKDGLSPRQNAEPLQEAHCSCVLMQIEQDSSIFFRGDIKIGPSLFQWFAPLIPL